MLTGPTLAIRPNSPDVIVKFERKPVLNNYRTQEEGRPIHDSVIFISKTVIGTAGGPFQRPMYDADKRDFPDAWAAFEAQNERIVEGTRLEDWGVLACEQIADLKGVHVMTVEDIARLTDSQVQDLGMGAMAIRERAQAYLASAKDKNIAPKLAAEVKELEAELRELRQIVKDQAAEIKALREDEPRKKR